MYNLAMSARPLPKGARLVPKSAKLVFRGEIFDTYQWDQEMYDGSTATFEMLKRPDTVEIIAVKDGKVVIEEQEQPGKPKHLTLPAGRVEPGEDVLVAAQREMLEETGMSFAKWELKFVYQPAVKIDWLVHTFLATDFTEQVDQNLDNGERIATNLVKFAEIIKLMRSNDMEASEYIMRQLATGTISLEDVLRSPNFKEQE